MTSREFTVRLEPVDVAILVPTRVFSDLGPPVKSKLYTVRRPFACAPFLLIKKFTIERPFRML